MINSAILVLAARIPGASVSSIGGGSAWKFVLEARSHSRHLRMRRHILHTTVASNRAINSLKWGSLLLGVDERKVDTFYRRMTNRFGQSYK